MTTWHLGTLKGTGIAFVNGMRVGPLEYEIQVTRDDSGKTAFGTVTGDGKALFKILEGGMAKLKLADDAGEIDFMIEQLPVGRDYADIVISGPVPGY